MADTVWTVGALLSWTSTYFEAHGIESPRLDAELLLSHVLKKPRIALYTDFDQIVSLQERAQYREWIQKRVSGRSVAAITGKKEFMGLTFYVNEHVLIPRPDSETWIEKVIQYHRNDGALHIADLGTGSGALLISFLYYNKKANGIGIDISEKALETARQNGETLGISARAEWRLGDYTDALGEGEVFDGILTNPPYIPSADMEGLPKEVKAEPPMALDGGDDGLSFYKRLALAAPKAIRSGGFIAAEVGDGQAGSVKNMLMETDAFEKFEIIQDYGGIERAVYAKRK
ncbi:MAG: peptide chain release factor N(5)-glutamine methyltransferase [Dialister sp.]|nr:peptide chain release factor N(5)-glutamine methyltransferase [Dialister sp.]